MTDSDRLGFYNDDEPRCPECGELLEQVWENQGFMPPDPTHYEVVELKCPECGYKENV